MDRTRRLLILCSGNICRSPMAHGMAVQEGERRDLPLDVRSAGTLQIQGAAAAPRAIEVCREIGLDITGHRSQGLTAELIRWADIIVVMEVQHAVTVREMVPEVGEEKLFLLGSFGGLSEIDDPINSWFKGPYRTARDEIQRCLDAFLDRWTAGQIG